MRFLFLLFLLPAVLYVGCVPAGKYVSAMRQVDRANVQREIMALEIRRVQDTLNALRRAYDKLKADHAQRESGLNGLIADQQLRIQESTQTAEQRERSLEGQLVEQQAALQQSRSILGQVEVLDGLGADVEMLESLKADLTNFERTILEREQRLKMAATQQRQADSVAQTMETALKSALAHVPAGKIRISREGEEVILALSTDWLYEAGTSSFVQDGATVVQTIAQFLSQRPEIIARIEGHTDNSPVLTGLGTDSWELGFIYAKSFGKSLIEDLKVNPMQVQLNSFGFYRPAALNTTPEGKAANRRLEIHFVRKR